MNDVPSVSTGNQTPGCCCKTGNKLCIAAIVCAILAIVMPLVGLPILVGMFLSLATLVFSILAIVKGSKAFGITMLILSFLVGPTSCTIGVWKNEDVQKGLTFVSQQLEENQAELKEIQAAKESGDTKKAKELQKQLKEKITSGLEKELQKEED